MVDHDTRTTSATAKPSRHFGFALGASIGLGNFLASVIGAEVELRTKGGVEVGQIVMVDERTRVVAGSTDQTEQYHAEVLLSSESCCLTRVPCDDILSARLLDAQLQAELHRALKAELMRNMPAPPPSDTVRTI
jgi:hypothetical protein